MKPRKDFLTDEQVEQEIERLNQSDAVQLSRQEQRIKYKRRQYLYQLRWHEKRGKQLIRDGVTMEQLELMEKEMDQEQEVSKECGFQEENGIICCFVSKSAKTILEIKKRIQSYQLEIPQKKFLEQPGELREEIQGIENIEKYIDDFIQSQ